MLWKPGTEHIAYLITYYIYYIYRYFILLLSSDAAYCSDIAGDPDCTVLAELVAEDVDTNSSLEYKIIDVKAFDEFNSPATGDYINQFGVGSTEGTVFVKEKLNREDAQRFEVTVEVVDVNAVVDVRFALQVDEGT